jgi:choline dehydrogenase-like flavoprotein
VKSISSLYAKRPTWKDYIIAPVVDLENLSDDALDQLIRNSPLSAFDMVGTAAMSARNAPYGVVDPDLLVKGVKELSINGASVFVSDNYSALVGNSD